MPKNWRAGPMTYQKWHVELRKLKGTPGACVLCGHAGKNEWALKEEHHVDGERRWVENVNEYEALCVSCHRKRDFSEEHAAKISAALVGRTFSDEHRANLSAARRRYEMRRMK